MSSSGSVLNDRPYCNGIAFGMGVQQTAPNNYLNTSTPYGESFHSPFSDYRFPKVPVRVLCHQESEQSEPFGLSNKTKAQQSDENILYTSQSGLRIDRVWSLAVKANSLSINANHSPLDSTLKDTAVNGFSGIGRSSPQISSIVDNNLHQSVHIPDQDRIDTFSKPDRPIAMTTSQLNSKQLQQNTSSKNEFDCNASATGESLTNFPDKASRKAYEQSEKRKAARKAYEKSKRGMAYRKAYEQSERRKASHKAYSQSDKGKASRKAYLQSDKGKAYQKRYQKRYQKAYREVFNNTGDREQAKIAGKQATAFMRKSNKSKNSELELISISSLIPPTLLVLTGQSIIEG